MHSLLVHCTLTEAITGILQVVTYVVVEKEMEHKGEKW